uniref:PqqD family peptide modification chaperone n=1 Tax=uncultured Erythrobacter sp. TaxID=263913 RepID=UPI0026282163|nr:PqqD family peptide modification chaperone [uncultured Erythrobacter sp.]
MNLNDRFVASEDVVAREVSGETVLLDLTNGQYFGLDPVGGRIWELLSEKPRSLSAVCDTIESEYDAPRETIEADILALAADLAERDLIVAEAG